MVLLPAFFAYAALWPALEITTSNTVDPTEPFATPFTLRNSAWLPIRNVEFRCQIAVVFEGGCTVGGSIRLRQPVRELKRGHPETFYCFRRLKSFYPVSRGEMVVDTTFRIRGLPFRRSEAFRFKFIPNATGTWVPRAPADQYAPLSAPNVSLGDFELDRFADEESSRWGIMAFGPGFQCNPK